MPRLENWSVVMGDINPYQPPEMQKHYLQGAIFDDTRFTDGTAPITTSSIVDIVDGKVRTRTGTLYELGEVDPNYEKLFPGAKERLLKQKGK